MRLANLPPCLMGTEACVGAHHLSRKLQMLGHGGGGKQAIAEPLFARSLRSARGQTR